jgi:hypothetical protein
MRVDERNPLAPDYSTKMEQQKDIEKDLLE